MPIISVIIPTYNREKYLLEAIKSVLCQSIKDIEILVVDDGSTDNTRQILEDFNSNGCIRYLWKKNEGDAYARNFGLRHAQGTYIAFLDSDDLLVDESLSRQLNVLLSDPEIGLVHADFEKFKQTGQRLGRRDISFFQGSIYPQILCHWNSIIAIDTVMVPRYVFTEVGEFNTSLRLGSDMDMWRRIARKYKYAHIPDVLARVRVHEGNISGNRTNEADIFHKLLDLAFEDDPDLPDGFRKQCYGQMYTTTGLNLLTDHGISFMAEARRRFRMALQAYPQSWRAYAGWVLSFLPLKIRNSLGQTWRKTQYPLD